MDGLRILVFDLLLLGMLLKEEVERDFETSELII